jgi:hypothetical protein
MRPADLFHLERSPEVCFNAPTPGSVTSVLI